MVTAGNRRVDRRLLPDQSVGEKPEPYNRTAPPGRENPLFGSQCHRDRSRSLSRYRVALPLCGTRRLLALAVKPVGSLNKSDANFVFRVPVFAASSLCFSMVDQGFPCSDTVFVFPERYQYSEAICAASAFEAKIPRLLASKSGHCVTNLAITIVYVCSLRGEANHIVWWFWQGGYLHVISSVFGPEADIRCLER